METLESSRVCRLCGKHSGISINIFDKNESHVKKINAVLPIMVHEMDLLPKHMCHRCSYKLEEFHKFYVDCLKTDEDLKGQLSWMRKVDSKERSGVPMVHIENVKIKAEPPDYNVYDLDPIVDNVNYINSMSTVTFPVNGVPANRIHEGITYAAYARCGCCCDKKDQSKETVSTNYETTASRCSRFPGADKNTEQRCPAKLQVIKRNLMDDDAFQDRPSTNLRCADETKEIPKCRIASSGLDVTGDRIKSNRDDELASGSTIVRNLRPKGRSVDYAGTRKKSSPAAVSSSKRRSKSAESKMTSQSKSEPMQIKLEKPDNFEERVLRPRKKAIDYFDKKRYLKCMGREQHASANDENHGKYRIWSTTCESKAHPTTAPNLITNDRTKFAIKQELLEDAVQQESISMAPRISKRRKRSTAVDSDENVSALPNNVLVNVHNDIANYDSLERAQLRSNFPVANKFKSPRSSKRRLKLNKLEFTQISGISYSPKHLRSQDVYLRNGKLRNFDGAERSVRKVRNNHRSTADDDRIPNPARTIKGTFAPKKDSATMKFVDNNIKRFCEKCNVSFASKELFKLHACYG